MNQILTWIDSGKKFGIPIEECKEVNRDIRITEVPHARSFISGIVNLRGDTVTVINLGSLLGYTQEAKREHFITIRLKTISNNIAIRADEVDDILEIDESTYESALTQLGEAEAKYIKHVVMSSRGLILVLDTDSIQNLNV